MCILCGEFVTRIHWTEKHAEDIARVHRRRGKGRKPAQQAPRACPASGRDERGAAPLRSEDQRLERDQVHTARRQRPLRARPGPRFSVARSPEAHWPAARSSRPRPANGAARSVERHSGAYRGLIRRRGRSPSLRASLGAARPRCYRGCFRRLPWRIRPSSLTSSARSASITIS